MRNPVVRSRMSPALLPSWPIGMRVCHRVQQVLLWRHPHRRCVRQYSPGWPADRVRKGRREIRYRTVLEPCIACGHSAQLVAKEEKPTLSCSENVENRCMPHRLFHSRQARTQQVDVEMAAILVGRLGFHMVRANPIASCSWLSSGRREISSRSVMRISFAARLKTVMRWWPASWFRQWGGARGDVIELEMWLKAHGAGECSGLPGTSKTLIPQSAADGACVTPPHASSLPSV